MLWRNNGEIMNIKNRVFGIVLGLSFFITQFLHTHTVNEKPHIVILSPHSILWSGVTTHVLNFYKVLVKNGYPVSVYSNRTSKLDYALKQINVASKHDSELQSELEDLCKEKKSVVVICNKQEDLTRIQSFRRKLPLKIIFTQHMDDLGEKSKTKKTVSYENFHHIDGITGATPYLTDIFCELNTRHNLAIKKIMAIPPFFDEERFLSFSTTQNHADFFKSEYDIDPEGLPVICAIGNMYENLSFKNYPLLLKALNKIIYEKHKPVHLVIVGSGVRIEYLRKMSRELELKPFVHFLGFSQDIPAIMYHSDFHVLASSNESFGIVYLEAALMKKPSIGATGTGAEYIIKHEHTGLLFKNNDLDDLVKNIEQLIDQPKLCQILGENAYVHVQQNFSNNSNFLKFEQLLQSIS